MRRKEYGMPKQFQTLVKTKEQKPMITKMCPKCKTEIYNLLDHMNHF